MDFKIYNQITLQDYKLLFWKLKLQKNLYKNNIPTGPSFAYSSQKNDEKADYFVSTVYLTLKVCFSLLAIISLIKLGYTSKVRLTRLKEIQNSFIYEQSRFKALSNRFDDLFSFEGEQRFMKDQDQMISRDIIRVIWRWQR